MPRFIHNKSRLLPAREPHSRQMDISLRNKLMATQHSLSGMGRCGPAAEVAVRGREAVEPVLLAWLAAESYLLAADIRCLVTLLDPLRSLYSFAADW
ncbi:hypothetical protein NDU88_011721 [Pleurodeles waltl]|uniref:Uncharacterized protein n=1 Tax=Pleurodeles waltl TaxID=8319 RepID=A0AAV7QZY2_PLEWA|nr:hypothetical protein NDU88_011721 [Pleurodeles waltl]